MDHAKVRESAHRAALTEWTLFVQQHAPWENVEMEVAQRHLFGTIASASGQVKNSACTCACTLNERAGISHFRTTPEIRPAGCCGIC